MLNVLAPLERTWVDLRSRYFDPLRARWVLREEHRLLREGPRPEHDDESIVFFSLHRSGSTFLHRILRDLAETQRYRTINLERYWTLRGRPLDEAFSDEELLGEVIHPRGYYYGPFRRWRKLPGLDHLRVLLSLRDPRDVLTSQYFSLTRSHRMLSARHYDRRREARRQEIDAFVRSEAEAWAQKYFDYFDHLPNRDNVLMVRYEDLTERFRETLRAAAGHLGLPTGGTVWEETVPEVDFSVSEDADRHKRQVAWGDHRKKLRRSTVQELNRRFEPILDRLDYPV